MTKPNKENRNVLILAFLAFALLIAAYANHFENGFHFDDYHTIVNNLYIRNIHNIPAFFSDPKMFSSDPTHWGLRSVVTTTLAIDYWLGGSLDPFWFQMSTFIWHILLCVVLFFMYRSILKSSFKDSWPGYLAIAATSWFALHTANAETLNYIISRSDVLSTFMITLSLFIYISWPAKRKYYLYIIPAILGVFAKETVLVLVILLFFYILIFEKELSFGDLFRAKNFKKVLGILLQILPLTIAVVIVQIYTLTRISSIPGITNPLLPYVLTQSYVWVHYFIAFFLPVNLSADSDWTVINNYFDERIIIGCVFIIVLLVTIIKTSAKKETRPIAFGLIWFSAALLPTSLAPFAEVTNDHRMYFPFIGLALSVITYAGILIDRYSKLFNAKYYYAGLIGILFLILGLNAYGVSERNKVWHDDESLWSDVVKKSPLNGRGLMNYGVVQMGKGNYVVAKDYFRRAEVFVPTYNVLYLNMAVVDSYLHDPTEAEDNFNNAIAFGPNDFNSYLSYAEYLNWNGKAKEAQPLAQKAMQLNPYSEQVMICLMTIDNELDMWGPLEEVAKHYLSIAPNNKDAQIALKAAQQHLPMIVNGITYSLPVTAGDYVNLSLIYYRIGLYEKSIDECHTALKLKPGYDLAYCNIGAAYLKLGQWDQSIAASKMALSINPANTLANNNLRAAESKVQH
jgi:tetratricopeptide (TPR) repeat protein